MTTIIDNAIEVLAKEIRANMSPEAALKFTQSILNLAHAKINLDNIKEPSGHWS